MKKKNSNFSPKSRINYKKKSNQRPVLWLLPLLVFMSAFYLIPIVNVIRLSFTNATLIRPSTGYTLQTFIRVLTDRNFPGIISVTLFFVFFSVLFQFLLGFLIALSVNKGEQLFMKGTVLTRTLSLVSWAIPGVAIGIIWRIMYGETASGILNHLLSFVGVGPIPFLSDPQVALASATVANVWRGTAQSMILLYAGLKTVPMDILEAASVDGANGFRKLISVVIPAMKPVIMINLLLNTIATFNTFDMIMPLTGGGPGRSTEVLILNVFRTTFQQMDLSRGAATAVVVLMINVLFGSLYLWLNRRDRHG